MALNFKPPPNAEPAPPADASDLEAILRQFDAATAAPERLIERAPEPEPRVVARNGIPVEPQPAADWPAFPDVIARQRQLEERKMEDQDRSHARTDLDAAAAAVRNVNATPITPRKPTPAEVVDMNDREYAEYQRKLTANTWGDLDHLGIPRGS
jgi:hypothetical protein